SPARGAGQLLAAEGLRARCHECVARPRALDLVKVLVDVFQRAPGVQKLDSGLLADAGHAGDVIRGIADERLVIDDLLRLDAHPLADLFAVVHGDLAGAPTGKLYRSEE